MRLRTILHARLYEPLDVSAWRLVTRRAFVCVYCGSHMQLWYGYTAFYDCNGCVGWRFDTVGIKILIKQFFVESTSVMYKQLISCFIVYPYKETFK